MVRIALDLDEVRMGGGNVEPGTWRAKVLTIEEEESSTGNPMLTWEWGVQEGPSQGETIRSWTSLLDNALGSFKNHVEAFGYSGKVEVDTDEIEGQEAMIVVAMRKRRNRETGDEQEFPSIIAVKPLAAAAGARNGTSTSPARRVGGGSKPAAAATSLSRRVGGGTSRTTGSGDLPF